jgi:hypothetical protein
MAAGLYDITTQTLGKGHFAVVKLAKHCLTGRTFIFILFIFLFMLSFYQIRVSKYF